MPFNLSRKIKRPSDGKEVEFDGRLPEPFDFITQGDIPFDREAIDKALQEGQIDDITHTFLKNVLVEASVDEVTKANVIRDSRLYMARLLSGRKPGRDLFERMHELGYRHHVAKKGLGRPLSLDISRYDFNSLELGHAIIGGDLIMVRTNVRGLLDLRDIKIGHELHQQYAHVEGDMLLGDASVGGNVLQQHAKVKGDLDQRKMIVEADLEQGDLVVGGELLQRELRALGNLEQSDLHVKSYLSQTNMAVGCDLMQNGSKIKGSLYQNGMRVGGNLDQDEIVVEGDVHQSKMKVGGNLMRSDARIKGDIKEDDVQILGKSEIQKF
jgi:hypothetical protein